MNGMVKLKQKFEKSHKVCTWKRPGSNGALQLLNGNLNFIVESVNTNSDSLENLMNTQKMYMLKKKCDEGKFWC